MAALVRSMEEELLFSIAIKRNQMMYVAKKKGLGHRETVKISQELDVIIVTYQQMIESFNLKKQSTTYH